MTEHWGYCPNSGRPHVPSDMVYAERNRTDNAGNKTGTRKLAQCKHCRQYFNRR